MSVWVDDEVAPPLRPSRSSALGLILEPLSYGTTPAKPQKDAKWGASPLVGRLGREAMQMKHWGAHTSFSSLSKSYWGSKAEEEREESVIKQLQCLDLRIIITSAVKRLWWGQRHEEPEPREPSAFWQSYRLQTENRDRNRERFLKWYLKKCI